MNQSNSALSDSPSKRPKKNAFLERHFARLGPIIGTYGGSDIHGSLTSRAGDEWIFVGIIPSNTRSWEVAPKTLIVKPGLIYEPVCGHSPKQVKARITFSSFWRH